MVTLIDNGATVTTLSVEVFDNCAILKKIYNHAFYPMLIVGMRDRSIDILGEKHMPLEMAQCHQNHNELSSLSVMRIDYICAWNGFSGCLWPPNRYDSAAAVLHPGTWKLCLIPLQVSFIKTPAETKATTCHQITIPRRTCRLLDVSISVEGTQRVV